MRFASAILAIAWTSLIGSTKITNAAKVQVSVTANQHPSQGQQVEPRRLDDCLDKCMCTKDYDPVCGSDGKTYGNRCYLGCEACKTETKITLASQGECPRECSDVCPCPLVYDPVCGSDGKTYGNMCHLECNKKCNPDLTMASKGECPTECSDVCPCPLVYDPVCGSDGKTYSNMCHLECNKKCNPDLTMVSKGECSKAIKCGKECSCTKEYDPVCGSDGKTYGNRCYLGCEACETETEITVASEGECPRAIKCGKECLCNKEYDPVCGSDGKTYSNRCVLGCEACETETKITLASQGECPRDYCILGPYRPTNSTSPPLCPQGWYKLYTFDGKEGMCRKITESCLGTPTDNIFVTLEKCEEVAKCLATSTANSSSTSEECEEAIMKCTQYSPTIGK